MRTWWGTLNFLQSQILRNSWVSHMARQLQGREHSESRTLKIRIVEFKILPRPKVCWELAEQQTVLWQLGYEDSEDIRTHPCHSDIHGNTHGPGKCCEKLPYLLASLGPRAMCTGLPETGDKLLEQRQSEQMNTHTDTLPASWLGHSHTHAQLFQPIQPPFIRGN